MKSIAWGVVLIGLLFGLASSVVEAAEERIEGTVVSTVMTACGMKPGTCAGSLVLDTKGTDGQVTVQVPPGTQIRKSNDHVFLPSLKGNQVVIAYVNHKGARVAKSIEVKSGKP